MTAAPAPRHGGLRHDFDNPRQASPAAGRAFAAIRASVLRPVLDHVAARGGDVEALLARSGVARKEIDDAYALVPMKRYLALFEDAAGMLDEPLLGARLGAQAQPADIGPVGLLFSCAATIGEAFDGMARSMNALQGGTAALLAHGGSGEESVWTYRLTDPALGPCRQDAEFTLSANCRFVRACFWPRWAPLEVNFEHAAGSPADAAALERIFRAPVRFLQGANRLVMDGAELRRSFRTQDGGLVEVLRRHIAELRMDEAPSARLQDRIRALLAADLGRRPVTIATVARDLGLSPRTLQRRLREEGTSLRDLLRAYRAETARTVLRSGTVTCTALAARLGYADPTAFWRAHRNWTGHAPSHAVQFNVT